MQEGIITPKQCSEQKIKSRCDLQAGVGKGVLGLVRQEDQCAECQGLVRKRVLCNKYKEVERLQREMYRGTGTRGN